MKTLIKKSLLVLMVAFIAVFTLGVSSKVKAANDVTFTIGTSNYTAGYNSSGTSGTKTVTSSSLTLSYAYSGINTQSQSGSAYSYTMYLSGKGFIYSNQAIENYYPSEISVTFTSGTSKSGTILATFSSTQTSTLVSATASVTQGGTYTATNTNEDNVYWNISTGTKNVQITKITIKYSQKSSSGDSTPTPSIELSGDTYTKVGDIVTLSAKTENVTGTIKWESSNTDVASVDENGAVTAKSMGTTNIKATVDGVEDTFEFTVYPTDGSELTIAEALQVCQLTGTTNCPFTYSVVGTISSIDTPYDSGYKNISVTITDGTNSIKAYRMKEGSELLVDQQIKVTGTLVNYSGNTPEFIAGCTYELVVDESTSVILESLNNIIAYMSLAYKYTTIEKEVAVTSEVSDILNVGLTGISGTAYADWSGKTSTSSAVWKGQSSAGSNDDVIQLRSKNSNSGIVTTSSGGKVSKVIITWNSSTTNGRTLDIYGSNTAYTSPTELYNDSTKGEKLGSIVKGTSTELEIFGDYTYIGLRSNDGAMYITSIEVVWAVEGEGTTTEMGFEDVDFRIKCGVDKALADIEGVESYGIKVSTSEKSMELTATGDDDLCLFAVVSLGDVLTNAQRLDVVFTVQAYVVVNGVTYVSNLTKSNSVRDMVETYYADAATTDLVASLYNLITE